MSCESPYIEIDKENNSLMELEVAHNQLFSQAVLFEIPLPESNILVLTKKSLRLNKHLWDFVYMVKSWVDVWQSTLWKNIDSEFMDIELKRFSKDLKGIISCKITCICNYNMFIIINCFIMSIKL